MKNGQIDLKKIGEQSNDLLQKLGKYKVLVFFLLVATLYGFILWRINVYSNAPPDQNEESAQLATQHILISRQSRSCSAYKVIALAFRLSLMRPDKTRSRNSALYECCLSHVLSAWWALTKVRICFVRNPTTARCTLK